MTKQRRWRLIRAKAIQLAKNAIIDEIKANGGKVKHYFAVAIVREARKLVLIDPAYLWLAAEAYT